MANGISFDGKFYAFTAERGELGIENLKSVVGFAGDVARKVKAFKEDGRFDWIERLRSLGIVVEGVQLLPKYRVVVDEIADLGLDEYNELVAHAVREFNLGQSEAAFLIANLVPKVLQLFTTARSIYDSVDDLFA